MPRNRPLKNLKMVVYKYLDITKKKKKGSSIYQIGGQPGQRSEELMFIFKSVVAMYQRQGKMIIVQGFCVFNFFVKEMIEDGVLTCLKRGADPKAV